MGDKLLPLVTRHFLIQPQSVDKLWEEEWSVTLRDDADKKVGRFHFEEAGIDGEVTLLLDIEPAYQKPSLGAEIYSAIASFVFKFQELKVVRTSCRHEDDDLVHSLEKAGYVRRKNSDGRDFYSITKQKTSWTGLYMILGLVAGLIIGITISNLWVGTFSGIIIGTVIGYLIDKKV